MYYDTSIIDKIDGSVGLKLIRDNNLVDNQNINVCVDKGGRTYITRNVLANYGVIWSGTVLDFKEQFCHEAIKELELRQMYLKELGEYEKKCERCYAGFSRELCPLNCYTKRDKDKLYSAILEIERKHM